MSASSSTSQSLAPFPQEQPPLPLNRCPWCHNGDIEWWVSQTPKNPGKHFYKCEHHWVSEYFSCPGLIMLFEGKLCMPVIADPPHPAHKHRWIRVRAGHCRSGTG
ncbi:hypothetical protein ACQJBY_068660 [Aegilops geniculata]